MRRCTGRKLILFIAHLRKTITTILLV